MSELRVRFAARDAAVLQRVLGDPLLDGGAPETRVFRDQYFDTPEGDLERRGAWVRVRFAADAAPELAVELSGEASAAERNVLPPGAPAAQECPPEAAALFRAESEPARVLHALVDPARLVPWLEVETHRRLRRGEDGAALLCDALTAREGGTVTTLYEVEARLPASLKGPRKLLRRLEADYGLEPVTGALPVRARRGLAGEAVDWLVEAIRAARRVAVVAFADGRVAMRQEGRALRIPTGEGTGEDAVRRVLRETWDQAGASVRLLGTGPGSARRPATEVWLAEGAGRPLSGGAQVISVPLGELLAAAGTPALRDEATLAALHVLARSDLPTAPVAGGTPALRAAAEAPPSGPLGDAELPPGALLNMELSTLAFNRRVLALAADPATPLMERVRFLAIFGANLDEFFRVRVAGFKRQVAEGSEKRTLDGASPDAQLDAIGVRASRLNHSAYQLLVDELLPALAAHGIQLVHPTALDEEEQRWLAEHYERTVHAVLTPLSAGPGQPFPHVRNLRPAVAAILREPVTGSERLGLIELPDALPRFVALPGGKRFLQLEELIVSRLDRLYPGTRVEGAGAFRVTRSAELHLHGRLQGDLLHTVQEEVARRPFQPVVRLEVDRGMPQRLRDLLLRELRYEAFDRVATLGASDLYPLPGPLDLRGLRELAALEGPGLTYPPLEAEEPLPADRPVLETLRAGEVMVEFPRDSFQATVERFVLEAADDPAVLAIKLALYRTNRRSRIVEALRRAAAAGKQVVVLVELTARFDEERNIEWARYLRRHGIHVIYGVPGLKVHAKVALVVRRESDGIRRYAYVGTGNLNSQTAALYTDLGLFTADPVLAGELAEVFNLLTSAGGAPDIRTLLVAPFNMREGFLERIRRETEHALAGRGGHIRAKFNGLADRGMVAALYQASQAGVRVELIVRTICVLRPRVPGLSDNIRVISILGRHLEHARIFRFANDGDPEYLIGSGDWRTRNLSRRVEVAAPVRAAEHRARLDQLLEEQWSAPDAWELGPDGTYYQRPERPPGNLD